MDSRAHVPTPAAKGAPLGKLSVDPADYPAVRRSDNANVLHGREIPEPYDWLEDPDAAETAAFVAAQNALTQAVLTPCEDRAPFRALFEALYDYERRSLPSREGGRYFFSYNAGLANQPTLLSVADARDASEAPVEFLDPNTLSADGTVALADWAFSEDGSTVAYSLSSGGSDWRTVKFARVGPAGERLDLPDELKDVKFSSLAWTHDGAGIFYNDYALDKAHGDAGTETDANTDQRLRFHALGTPQADDPVVLAAPEPTHMLGAQVTDDGRYLLLSVSAGCEPANKLWFVDLAALPRAGGAADAGALDLAAFDLRHGADAAPLPVVKLVNDFASGSWSYVGSTPAGEWLLKTNCGAPRGRVVAGAPAGGTPPTAWPDLIPQHEKDLLQWVARAGPRRLAVCWLRDVKGVLELRELADGALATDFSASTGIGSFAGFSGDHRADECLFSFTSFAEPGAQYRFDASEAAPAPELVRRPAVRFRPESIEVKQVFVPSADGTKVPMFIVHRADAAPTAASPVLLYGYGGFNISLPPSFSIARVAWLLGFEGADGAPAVYAVANCRGGGEYGRQWRDDGSRLKKQNVFDDFQACAAWLPANGYGSAATLATQGGSNGGLLVAACANQAPHLQAAVLAQVGVMDMLRFPLFTIGHAWVTDYGSPQASQEDYDYIVKYSPLHNVIAPADGGGYPAVLITTGDHDDRVVPLHSLKLLAELQARLAGGAGAPQRAPLLGRIEVRAGHGAGKPTSKIIDEAADMYGFAAAVAGARWAAPELLPDPRAAA